MLEFDHVWISPSWCSVGVYKKMRRWSGGGTKTDWGVIDEKKSFPMMEFAAFDVTSIYKIN